MTELAYLKFRVTAHAVEVVPISITDPLLIKVWNLSPAAGFKLGSDPKELLLASGVAFPAGATAALSPDGRRLIIKDSQENMDLVDDLLAAADETLADGASPAENLSAVNSQFQAIERINQKLNTIIIPRLEFRNTTVREAVDFLRRKSVDLDAAEPEPAKRGMNIVLKTEAPFPSLPGLEPPSPAPLSGVNPEDARITVSPLTNIPLLEALKYVTDLADLKFKVEPFGVSIVPVGDSNGVLISKEWKLNEAMLSALGIVAGYDAKEGLTANGVNFPAQATARWVPVSKRLFMRNTRENLDRVDALLFETK